MTKNELLNKVEKIANNYECKYHGCNQCLLGAFRDTLGEEIITDLVFKAGSGLNGGVCGSGNACGTVTAGMMVISLFKGRDYQHFEDGSKMMEGFKIGQQLIDKTIKEYGSINCYDIQDKLTGRHYSCWSEEDQKIAEEIDLHTKVCSEVVGKSARWIMEILIDNGLLNPADY